MGSLLLTLHMHQHMGKAGTAEHKHPFSNQPGLSVQDHRTVRALNKHNKEGLLTIKPIHYSSSKTFLKESRIMIPVPETLGYELPKDCVLLQNLQIRLHLITAKD